jgi:hypothetical protein
MKRTTIVIVGLLICLSSKVLSQTSKELGIGLTTEKDQKVFLNYFTSTKHNYSLSIRLSQGWDIEDRYAGSQIITTPSSSEDLMVQDDVREVNLQSKVFFGPEFRIKESIFSWGVEAVLGYRFESYENTETTYRIQYLNFDPIITSIVIPSEGSELVFSAKTYSLTTGIQSRFVVKALASERIGMNLFAELGVDYKIQLAETLFNADPPDPAVEEYYENEYEGEVLSLPSNYFIPRARLGATLFLFK